MVVIIGPRRLHGHRRLAFSSFLVLSNNMHVDMYSFLHTIPFRHTMLSITAKTYEVNAKRNLLKEYNLCMESQTTLEMVYTLGLAVL